MHTYIHTHTHTHTHTYVCASCGMNISTTDTKGQISVELGMNILLLGVHLILLLFNWFFQKHFASTVMWDRQWCHQELSSNFVRCWMCEKHESTVSFCVWNWKITAWRWGEMCWPVDMWCMLMC